MLLFLFVNFATPIMKETYKREMLIMRKLNSKTVDVLLAWGLVIALVVITMIGTKTVLERQYRQELELRIIQLADEVEYKADGSILISEYGSDDRLEISIYQRNGFNK